MASVEHRLNKSGDAWRVVWREDGKKQSETFYTLAEAETFHAHVEANDNRWPRGWIPGKGWDTEHSDTPSFMAYAHRTLEIREASDGTKATYRRLLANHVEPVIGQTPIGALTRYEIAAIDKRMKDAGRADKTRANVHALVSSILNDAHFVDRIIDRNPAKGRGPKVASSRSEDMWFLTHGEFATLARCIALVGREEDVRLARLLVGTGARWSEATALQVWDVDLLGRRAFDIRRAWKRNGTLFELGDPKTVRSRRSLAISDELADLFIPQVSGKQPREFVFTAERGGAIRHSNWYHRVWRPALIAARYCDTHRPDPGDVRKAQRRAERAKQPAPAYPGCGCPGVLTKQPRIHDLRHSHASWLLADGVDLVAIQRRLGHESIQTTIDRYSHLSPSHVEAVNASVDRALART